MASIREVTNALANRNDTEELKVILDTVLVDLTELRTELAAGVADYVAGRAEIVKLVTDYTAGRAEVVKLVTDRTSNNTMLGNLKTYANNLRSYIAGDQIINATALSVGSTPENVASTAFQYQVDGVDYTKAAVAAGTAFTAADTINTGAAAGQYWGVWLLQINAAGTISTKSPGADQVYADEATAIAALPATDALNTSMGYVTIQSNTDVDWVAQTDDITAASDCAASNFYNTASGIPAAISDTASATAANPAAVTAANPAAATASTPAALTTLE